MMILVIRFHQETPNMVAASSISADNWSMELVPAFVANGRYLTEPTNTRIVKELARKEKLDAIAR